MFSSSEKKLLFILAAVQFNHIVDFMIIMPLGPQLMRLFSINPDQFSLLVSAYTFTAGLSGILASFYMDYFDRKKSLLFLFIGFTVSTAFCGLARSYETLLVARALTGFFGGVANSIILSIISDVIDYKRRGTAMGYLATSFSVASIFGVPFSLYIAHKFEWYTPFLFLAALCVFIVIAALKYIPQINAHLVEKKTVKFWIPVWQIIKNPQQRLALAFMFFVMSAHFAVIPFVSPAFVANAGLPESKLMFVYLIGGICSIITAPFVGKLSDKYGKAKIFFYAVLFSIIPVYLVTHLEKMSVFSVLLISGVFFISAGSRMIPAHALISSAASPQQRGSFMSLVSSVQSISMAFGAYVAGQIVTRDQVTGQLQHYSTVGFLAIGIGLFTLFILQKIKYLDHKNTPLPGNT